MKSKLTPIDYFKRRRGLLLWFAVVFLLLCASFYLYRLPVMAVVYPFSLGLLALFVYMIFDYRGEVKRNEEIMQLEKRSNELKREIIDSEEKNIRRTEYYSVWAHQIKTPISSMKLSLQSADTQASRRLCSDLYRIESYVDMAMTYLRLDSDTTDYLFAECSLDKIVKDAVKKLSTEFILRKIILEYVPVSQTVLTDEKWLSFVVEQVLSNALKYIKEGSVKIYMEEPLTLCVADTGIGISAEDLPRIFEKGFTGYNGRTDKKASGIGLYLCRRICDDLGCEISAASKIGVGTTVRIALHKDKAEPN